jgi:hypothetical protein
MKISEMVKKLGEIQGQFGDLDVAAAEGEQEYLIDDAGNKVADRFVFQLKIQVQPKKKNLPPASY